MNHLRKLVFTGVALVACAPLAFATPVFLVPNGVPVPIGTVITNNTGTVSTTGLQTVTVSTFTATVSETVFHDSLNVDCANCLDYAWTFSNIGPGTAGPPADILFSSASGFSTLLGFLNFAPAVGYMPGTGVVPTNANESAVGTVTFDGYIGGVSQGQSTNTLVIETNSMFDRPGFITVSDSQSANYSGFIPMAAPTVPEPSSLLLLGTGLVGVAGMARRRFASR